MEVIYRKRFVNKLEKLLRYISDEFGEKGIVTFKNSLQNRLHTIKQFPESGQLTQQAGIRSAIAGKHIIIFYKIERSTVVVLNLFDMRMNPKKTPYSKFSQE